MVGVDVGGRCGWAGGDVGRRCGRRWSVWIGVGRCRATACPGDVGGRCGSASGDVGLRRALGTEGKSQPIHVDLGVDRRASV